LTFPAPCATIPATARDLPSPSAAPPGSIVQESSSELKSGQPAAPSGATRDGTPRLTPPEAPAGIADELIALSLRARMQ